MNQCGWASTYIGNGEEMRFNIARSGKRLLVEIELIRSHMVQGDPAFVEFVPGEKHQVTYEEKRAASAMEGLAQRLDGLFRFQRDPSGLLVPHLDGATLIVDRDGDDGFKAMDGSSGAVETVQKRALEVKGADCHCALKVLMNKGCQCGAMGRSA